MNYAGLNTYAFVGPLLPHFVANEDNLRKLFEAIKGSGTKRVWVEHINLTGTKMSRLLDLVGNSLTDEELKNLVHMNLKQFYNTEWGAHRYSKNFPINFRCFAEDKYNFLHDTIKRKQYFKNIFDEMNVHVEVLQENAKSNNF